MYKGITRNYGTIKCEVCGKETKKNSAMQKYCPECSEAKSRERSRKWAKNNPQPYTDEIREKNKQSARETATIRKEVGYKESIVNKSNITWPCDESDADDLNMLVRIKMPFSYKFSKNSLWSLAGRGHVYISREVMAIKEEIIWRIKSKGAEWYDGKVWIDIMVEKPNMKGDAINVVDMVCDAIKEAIGVDDRWFCIRRLDWVVVKNNPMIYIGVGQSVTENHQVCATCGRILPYSKFGSNKSNKNGISRDCLECARQLDADRRRRKKLKGK